MPSREGSIMSWKYLIALYCIIMDKKSTWVYWGKEGRGKIGHKENKINDKLWRQSIAKWTMDFANE